MATTKQHTTHNLPRLVCFALALVALNIWFNTIGYTAVLELDTPLAKVIRTVFIGTTIGMALICTLLGNHLKKHLALLDLVGLFCMILGGLSALSQGGEGVNVAIIVGYGLMGMSFAYAVVRLYFEAAQTLCAQGIMIVSVVLAVSYPLFGLLSVIGYPWVSAVVLLGAPLVFFVSLSLAKSKLRVDATSATVSLSPQERNALFVVAVLTSLPVVALRSSGLVGLWGSPPSTIQGFNSIASTLLLALISLGALGAAMYGIANSKQRGSVGALYLVLIILLALSQFINGMDDVLFAPFIYSVVTICCCSIHCYASIMFAQMMKRYAFNACGLFLFLMMLMTSLWISLSDIASIAVSVALFISIIVFIIGLWLDARKRAALSLQAEESYDEVALREFGLTRREREVFGYLAQGHSVPYIQKKLTLAESTVRVHVTHIYQKLRVTNRSEFLDKVHSR